MDMPRTAKLAGSGVEVRCGVSVPPPASTLTVVGLTRVTLLKSFVNAPAKVRFNVASGGVTKKPDSAGFAVNDRCSGAAPGPICKQRPAPGMPTVPGEQFAFGSPLTGTLVTVRLVLPSMSDPEPSRTEGTTGLGSLVLPGGAKLPTLLVPYRW